MKSIISLALAASFVATGSAKPHRQAHHHPARHAPSRIVEKRDTQTVYVEGPTVTVFHVAGSGEISANEAREGLDNGEYIVIGQSEPEFDAGPGVFKEEEEEQTEEPVPEPEVEKEEPEEEEAPEPSTSSSSSSSSTSAPSPSVDVSIKTSTGSGLDREFPSGELSCDSFPTGYGAISADYRGMNGWLGLQWGHGSIVTGIQGDDCTPGGYCSYLCPPGYEKSQWPSRQGDTHESIGGLLCNDDGKLELTRPEVKTLCSKGMGGVHIRNTLSQQVFACRTDYPGTEAMVIPLEAQPGAEVEVCNPDQFTYTWKGNPTSAQWYLNNQGLGLDQACVWDSLGQYLTSAGDKAPTNLGTGVNAGKTWLGLFANSDVSTALLDYNVRVFVDGEEDPCALVNGVYTGGGRGCTVAADVGQLIVVELYD